MSNQMEGTKRLVAICSECHRAVAHVRQIPNEGTWWVQDHPDPTGWGTFEAIGKAKEYRKGRVPTPGQTVGLDGVPPAELVAPCPRCRRAASFPSEDIMAALASPGKTPNVIG